MIGVVANPAENAVVREFFELFKTPWEFCRADRSYEVLLCAGDTELLPVGAKLTLIYSGQPLPLDTEEPTDDDPTRETGHMLSYQGARIPIYGECVAFRAGTDVPLTDEFRRPVMYVRPSQEGKVVRIGYSLFSEVRRLLTEGQPSANAGIPALELHIALLRDLIIESGVPLVEIPPAPEGYQFIACLTHDVDHPSIRIHRLDHTMFGFLYRAVVVSLFNALRGRAPWRNLWTNWVAACKLPLVYLGLARDFWSDFDAYIRLERGARSSFFMIPFANSPGRTGHGVAPRQRDAGYGAADLAAQIQKLTASGCEVGLHGIDAWCDSSRGKQELEEIRQLTGVLKTGVRMHWLYFDDQSPSALEEAGADYDSTSGYNETIGYRAGTTQAYKPLGVTRVLELPMHVMDTALFYPCYLDLSFPEARERISALVDNAIRLGGCMTINWHDRSLAPERLWGECYAGVVEELQNKGAWLATASQAVWWFRKRRSAVFENVSWESGDLRVKIAVDATDALPALQLRVCNGRRVRTVRVGEDGAPNAPASARKNSIETCVALS